MTIQVGKIYTSNNYGDFRVIEYNSWKDIKVEFINTGYVTNAEASNILDGKVKDKLKSHKGWTKA